MTNPTDPTRLLVGISNPDTMPRLVDLAVRLNRATGCEIVVTHVVRVPGQIGLAAARSSPQVVAARQLVQDALDRCQDAGVGAEGVAEVGREIDEGLITAARSRDADLVLVGYSENPEEADEDTEKRFDRVMHRVGRELDAHLLVGKFRGEATDRILVPVDPTSELGLIELLIRALAPDRQGAVHFLHVSSSGDARQQDQAVRQLLAESGLLDAGELETVSSDDIVEAVVGRSQEFDLMLLATVSPASPAGGIRGAKAERIAEDSACSTLLVRGGRPS